MLQGYASRVSPTKTQSASYARLSASTDTNSCKHHQQQQQRQQQKRPILSTVGTHPLLGTIVYHTISRNGLLPSASSIPQEPGPDSVRTRSEDMFEALRLRPTASDSLVHTPSHTLHLPAHKCTLASFHTSNSPVHCFFSRGHIFRIIMLGFLDTTFVGRNPFCFKACTS